MQLATLLLTYRTAVSHAKIHTYTYTHTHVHTHTHTHANRYTCTNIHQTKFQIYSLWIAKTKMVKNKTWYKLHEIGRGKLKCTYRIMHLLDYTLICLCTYWIIHLLDYTLIRLFTHWIIHSFGFALLLICTWALSSNHIWKQLLNTLRNGGHSP